MIRLFVGCAPNHEDAESQAVLEWSVRKLASEPVEITWMALSNDPQSPFHGWNTEQWATPFSGFRWAVPELAGFEGRAIYCDSDFIFLADIAELWNQYRGAGKVAIAKGGNEWRMCCTVFDCGMAQMVLRPIAEIKKDSGSHAFYNQYFRQNRLVEPFVGDWNNLDARNGENLGNIKALHYTCMSTQPQLKHALPRLAAAGRKHWFDGAVRPHPRADVQELFDMLLAEAIANGYPPEKYMQQPLFGEINNRRFAGRFVQ